LTYQLVNCAEQAKIALSDHNEHQINLDFLDQGLVVDVVRDTLKNANQHILLGVAKLMHEAVAQAQCQPDVVFVTGGTAQSPVLRAVIESQFPHCELVIGDHFGSVTAGLTRWAERIYR
jgi:hypothetical chaperone protein